MNKNTFQKTEHTCSVSSTARKHFTHCHLSMIDRPSRIMYDKLQFENFIDCSIGARSVLTLKHFQSRKWNENKKPVSEFVWKVEQWRWILFNLIKRILIWMIWICDGIFFFVISYELSAKVNKIHRKKAIYAWSKRCFSICLLAYLFVCYNYFCKHHIEKEKQTRLQSFNHA